MGGRGAVCDEREPEQDVTTVSATIARRTTRSNLFVLIENESVARHVVSSNFRTERPGSQSAVLL